MPNASGVVGGPRLVDVDHDQHRLGREELEAAQALLVVRVELDLAQRLLGFQRRQHDVGEDRRSRCSSGFRPRLVAFSSRSSRASTIVWSARISSRSSIATSRAGSTLPSGWRISGSSKARTTWTRASTVLSLARSRLSALSPLGHAGDVHVLHRRRHVALRLEQVAQRLQAGVAAPAPSPCWSGWRWRTCPSPGARRSGY